MSLTKKQEIKIRSLSKKGISQQKIAKTLHVRKQTISTYMQKAAVGKRAAPEGAARYWKDVSKVMEVTDASRSVASAFVGRQKKWGTKRAEKVGKHWSPIPERQKFWRDWKEAWREATKEEEEKLREKAEEWKDNEWTGDTPD